MALRRPFEGKGRQLVWADPDRSRLGFFYACCFPFGVGLHSFPPWEGRGGEGEASRGSSRRVASLSPSSYCYVEAEESSLTALVPDVSGASGSQRRLQARGR